jgi:SnoaL-like domain
MAEMSVEDRLALHELAARYANTIDARDWERFRTVFMPDCRYEITGLGRLNVVVHGNDDLTSFMIASLDHPVSHHVTNVEIDASGEAIQMFSKIIVTLAGGGSAAADYQDIVVNTTEGWKIADRLVSGRRPPRS